MAAPSKIIWYNANSVNNAINSLIALCDMAYTSGLPLNVYRNHVKVINDEVIIYPKGTDTLFEYIGMNFNNITYIHDPLPKEEYQLPLDYNTENVYNNLGNNFGYVSRRTQDFVSLNRERFSIIDNLLAKQHPDIMINIQSMIGISLRIMINNRFVSSESIPKFYYEVWKNPVTTKYVLLVDNLPLFEEQVRPLVSNFDIKAIQFQQYHDFSNSDIDAFVKAEEDIIVHSWMMSKCKNFIHINNNDMQLVNTFHQLSTNNSYTLTVA